MNKSLYEEVKSSILIDSKIGNPRKYYETIELDKKLKIEAREKKTLKDFF